MPIKTSTLYHFFLPYTLAILELWAIQEPILKVVLDESFKKPPEVSDVGWTGTYHHFEPTEADGETMLRLKGNATRSDTSWLAAPVSLFHGEWHYTIDINGDPSQGNRIDLVVMSDKADLKSNFSGYLLKAGENGSNDVIRLMRVDAGVLTPVLSGTTKISGGGSIQIRLVRSPVGQWQLFVAVENNAFELQDTAMDATYGNMTHSGFRVIYTRTRNMDFALGPLRLLRSAPQILRADLQQPTLLMLTTDSNLDPFSSVRVSVDGSMTPTAGITDGNTVRFNLEQPLRPGIRHLSLTGLTTSDGLYINADATFVMEVKTPPKPGDVLINEFLYHPPEDVPQFVELVNVSDYSINLKQWQLLDGSLGSRSITVDDHWLDPGSFLALTPDSSALRAYYGSPQIRLMPRFPTLNRGSKDAIILKSPDGLTIDSLSYSPTPASDGVSVERVSLKAPSWASVNWKPSVDRKGATPGRPNSHPPEEAAVPKLEWALQAAPDTLLMSFSTEIDLSSLNSVYLNGLRTAFASCTTRDYRVIRCAWAVPYPFETQRTTSIDLIGIRGILGSQPIDLKGHVSFIPLWGDLLVNEVLFNPIQSPFSGGVEQSQFVELINTKDRHLYLGNLRLLTKSTTGSSTSTVTFVELSSPVAAPGSLVVLHPDTNASATSRLGRFFGMSDSAVYLRSSRSTLGLSTSSGTVWIRESGGATIDSVRFDTQYHHPSVRDHSGVSLERISALASSLSPSSWGSHAGPLGGSPGKPNTIRLPDTRPSGGTVEILPNPFSPDNDGYEDAAQIALQLDGSGWLLTVSIYDRHGRSIRTLADGERVGSNPRFIWNGLDDQHRRAFTGLYLLLVEGWHVESRKATTLKKVVGLVHQPR